MITQSDKDKGMSCKGRGFNCPTCPYKGACVDYIETDTPELEIQQSPIGIMSKEIWEKKRIQDLNDAIIRYMKADVEVPHEWVKEYNELVSKYKDNKQETNYFLFKELIDKYDKLRNIHNESTKDTFKAVQMKDESKSEDCAKRLVIVSKEMKKMEDMKIYTTENIQI